MKVNRRSFLKLTCAVLASATVPSIAEVNKYPDFDHRKQYGDYVYITDWEDETLKVARKLLVKQIRGFIPPKYCNTTFIKFIYKEPGFGGSSDPLSQVGFVGWKYIPRAKS